jgi:hypothetical protein
MWRAIQCTQVTTGVGFAYSPTWRFLPRAVSRLLPVGAHERKPTTQSTFQNPDLGVGLCVVTEAVSAEVAHVVSPVST